MKKSTFIYVAIFVAALFRLIPHMPNFTPISAMALFSGALLDKKKAFLAPLIAMFISDCILQLVLGIGFHSLMPVVYLCLCLTTLLGLELKKNIKPSNIVGFSILGSVLFFIITNFAVWLQGGYTYTSQGLIECYVMALPFFGNTLYGDLFYSGVLFGLYSVLSKKLILN